MGHKPKYHELTRPWSRGGPLAVRGMHFSCLHSIVYNYACARAGQIGAFNRCSYSLQLHIRTSDHRINMSTYRQGHQLSVKGCFGRLSNRFASCWEKEGSESREGGKKKEAEEEDKASEHGTGKTEFHTNRYRSRLPHGQMVAKSASQRARAATRVSHTYRIKRRIPRTGGVNPKVFQVVQETDSQHFPK